MTRKSKRAISSPVQPAPPDAPSPSAPTEQHLFHLLTFYTLTHPDPVFLHQHAVDAFAAQLANEHTKPITLVFGLIGLYLHLEWNYTGRQVQLAHMRRASRRKQWPALPLPAQRGTIRVAHVLQAAPGPERDVMIHNWATSVWPCFTQARPQILEIAQSELDVLPPPVRKDS
ncbi:MAG TPA: DUF5946 family protein [Terracidiphilus sp.]|nr:DUF5946 family protein [Terracidiphilus sp.]